jgi:hypothetical protein
MRRAAIDIARFGGNSFFPESFREVRNRLGQSVAKRKPQDRAALPGASLLPRPGQ